MRDPSWVASLEKLNNLLEPLSRHINRQPIQQSLYLFQIHLGVLCVILPQIPPHQALQIIILHPILKGLVEVERQRHKLRNHKQIRLVDDLLDLRFKVFEDEFVVGVDVAAWLLDVQNAGGVDELEVEVQAGF